MTTTKKTPHLVTINGTEYLAESRTAATQFLKAVIKRATVDDVIRLGTENIIRENEASK